MTMHEALHLWDDIDMCQEKKKEKDSQVFKIAWMPQYDGSKIT